MFKVTEKKVKAEINICWNRARRNKKYFPNSLIFDSDQYYANLNAIKIKIKTLKRNYATIENEYVSSKANPQVYLKTTLTINQEFESKSQFESIVAHEMAHFVDFLTFRKSNHDLVFLHNFLLLSNKKNMNFKKYLVDHMGTYFMEKNKNSLKNYTNIVKAT